MSEFNPQVSGTPSTNFVNASQGRPANKAFETLFEGAANVYATYDKNKKQGQLDALTKEVQSGVDEIDSTLMGKIPDAATLFEASKSSEKLTGPLGEAQRTLQRWKMAYEQGNLEDTNYTLRVANLAKKLRVKYPNQIDKIDDLLSNATGTSTANQLRRELVSAWKTEAAATSAAAKEKDKFLNEVLEKGYLQNPTIKGTYEQITGKEFTAADFNEKAMRFAIGVDASQQASIERTREALALEADQEKSVSVKAKKAAIKEATIWRDRMITAASSSLNALRLQMSSAQADNSPGGTKVTPEEQAALEAVMGRVELEAMSAYDSLVNKLDKEGNSYAAMIGETNDLEDIKAVFTSPVSVIKDALANKQTGILSAIERDNAAKKIYSENKTLQDGDFTAGLAAAKSIYGDTRVNDILGQVTASGNDLSKMSPEDSAVAQKIMVMLMSGASPSETFKTALTNGDLNPANTMKIIETDIGQLSDPATTKEAKSDIIKRWFSSGEQNFLKQFNGASASAIFDTLTSPATVEAVKGTEYADDYFDWVRRQADVVLAPLASQIFDTQKFGDVSNITFNESTKRFEIAPVSGVAGSSPLEAYKARNGANAVSTMNRYLDKLQPIADELGENLDATIAYFFTGRDYRKIQKEGSVLSQLADKFFSSMQASTEDTMNKAKANLPQNPLDPAGGGSRSWRNNNPGNLKFGKFAEKAGAIGQDDAGFAIFPDYATGRQAKATLLFDSKNYKNLTISEAINRYAPREDDNPTSNYVQAIVQATGMPPDTPLSMLNEAQKERMLDAMEKFEGFKPGR